MDKAHMVQGMFASGTRRLIKRGGAATAAFATMLVAQGHAQAMDPEIGTAAETCEFPTTISIMQNCTGVYVGNGVILTAGHCARKWQRTRNAAALFGESKDEGWVLSLPFDQYEVETGHNFDCVAHPDGESSGDSYLGPDIGYCLLEDDPLVMHRVPPMIPTGCERDWLVDQAYHNVHGAPLTALGMGSCSFDPYASCENTTKRYAVQMLIGQYSYASSDTKLVMDRDPWEGDPGLRPGDSGGPVFARMPDDTWRLVGVNSLASSTTAYAEAVPPYLHWIESSSGRDITPGHDFINGSWVAVEDNIWGHAAGPAPFGHWNQVEESGHACLAHPVKRLYSYVEEPLFGGIECTGWPAGGFDDYVDNQPEDPFASVFEVDDWAPAQVHANSTPDFGLTVDTTAPVAFLPVMRSSTRGPLAPAIANMTAF